MTVGSRPFERGEQAAIFRDVVGVDADAFVELGDHVAVFVLDADAEACRSRVAARAAVDVRCDHDGRFRAAARRAGLGGAAGSGWSAGRSKWSWRVPAASNAAWPSADRWCTPEK